MSDLPKLRFTILGCGSSGGVPRIGGADGKGNWGACDPLNPKNRRRRCSILVERAHADGTWQGDLTTVLVDTSPDMREQLLSSGVSRLDAVFMTHDHADQSHGIDDLRAIAGFHRKRVPVYYLPETSPELRSKFSYCFEQKPGSGYPAILEAHELSSEFSKVIITGPSGEISVQAFLQDHGSVKSLGYLFGGKGGLAYSSDADGIPLKSMQLITGVECWIVDALRYAPHPSHAHVEKSLQWLKEAKVSHGVLTNLHIDLDYETLKKELPNGVEPAFDGMQIEFQQK